MTTQRVECSLTHEGFVIRLMEGEKEIKRMVLRAPAEASDWIRRWKEDIARKKA